MQSPYLPPGLPPQVNQVAPPRTESGKRSTQIALGTIVVVLALGALAWIVRRRMIGMQRAPPLRRNNAVLQPEGKDLSRRLRRARQSAAVLAGPGEPYIAAQAAAQGRREAEMDLQRLRMQEQEARARAAQQTALHSATRAQQAPSSGQLVELPRTDQASILRGVPPQRQAAESDTETFFDDPNFVPL